MALCFLWRSVAHLEHAFSMGGLGSVALQGWAPGLGELHAPWTKLLYSLIQLSFTVRFQAKLHSLKMWFCSIQLRCVFESEMKEANSIRTSGSGECWLRKLWLWLFHVKPRSLPLHSIRSSPSAACWLLLLGISPLSSKPHLGWQTWTPPGARVPGPLPAPCSLSQGHPLSHLLIKTWN